MSETIIDTSLALLRRRWPVLLGVAGLALGAAAMATSLVRVLGTPADAIVNGSVVMRGDPWTDVVLTVGVSGAQARVTVPVLLALGWFVAFGVSLRVLAGESLRQAWPRRAQVLSWLGLGAVLTVLATVGIYLSLLAGAAVGGLSSMVALLAGLVCACGLACLTVALPAVLVDGYDLPGSLSRAVSLTHRRALRTGTALIVIAVVAPAVVHVIVSSWTMPISGSWTGDVLWAGVPSLLEYLVLVVAVPAQAAVLLATYRVATADAPSPATSAEPEQPVTVGDGPVLSFFADGPAARRVTRPGWLGIAGLVLLLVVPAMVGPAVVLANPRGLSELTIARPEAFFSSRPLDVAVLADGTVATVDEMQAGVCIDPGCKNVGLASMPCIGGRSRSR